MYKKTTKGWSKHLDFILMDMLCFYLSFFIANFIRHRTRNLFINEFYMNFAIILAALHLIFVFFGEPYEGVLRRGYFEELKHTIQHVTGVVVGMFVYMFLFKITEEYSRIVVIIFWGLSIVCIYAERLLMKKVIRHRAQRGKNQEYLLVVSKYEDVIAFIEKYEKNNYSNTVIKGLAIVDGNMTGQEIEKIPVVTDKDNLLEFVRTNVVDEVMMNLNTEWGNEMVNQLVNMGVTVHVNLNKIETNYPNCMVEKLGGFNVLTTCINVATDRQLFLKRLMDLLGGIVGMIICAIAFVFVAPVITIQSPGPILFKQERVGKNGRKFKIYKFRSMYMDAEERKKELMSQNEMQGLMFKVQNDPRIFPFGHFIRNTSIDELPQFWNVLKGEMSLVGTRPPTVDEFEKYALYHKSRLAAKPGITGMWQVSGRSDITDFEEVVRLDNEYIRNWSLRMDIKIILKTIKVVLKREGSR